MILCPFLEIQSFSNFASFFATDECRIVSGKAFHGVLVKPIDPNDATYARFPFKTFHLFTRVNGLPQNTVWKAIPNTILRSSVAKNQANFKMTVFEEMGIESKSLNQIQRSWYHSLLRKMLYLMMYKNYTFRSQGKKNLLFRFFGNTRYSKMYRLIQNE